MQGQSTYIAMDDGTRLAADIWLPAGTTAQGVGAVIRATRYWRASVDSADPSAAEAEARLFTEAGLALVTVDVRGTGASFGTWGGPWSAREIADLECVVAWVAAQPWCNGRIGAHGVSYDGNTAELIGSLRRPEVKAVAPRFADYDPWAHLAAPGGVLLDSFLTSWAQTNRALDLDDPGLVAASPEEARELREWFGHPKPVEDADAVALAVREHQANLDLVPLVTELSEYDDAASQALGYPGGAPFARRAAMEESGTAMMHVGSWYDAGTAAGVIARFASIDVPQNAVIGAWSHGGRFDASPFGEPGGAARPPIEQQRAEVAEWLAFHLASGDGVDAPVREVGAAKVLTYYTVGADTWRVTHEWPPSGVADRRLWLDAYGRLVDGEPETGLREYVVDPLASTGPANRWLTQADGAPVIYADRASADQRCLVWDGPALSRPVTITGSPVLHLVLATTATDGAIHAYLEAVDTAGQVVYLTEGILRLSHRAVGPAPYAADGPHHPCTQALRQAMVPGQPERIELALFPTSAHVPAGCRLRVAIAGADRDTFAPVALGEQVTWSITAGAAGSWIDVPVEEMP